MGSNQRCKTKMFSTGRDVILILPKHRPWGGAKCIDKEREKGKGDSDMGEGTGPRNVA